MARNFLNSIKYLKTKTNPKELYEFRQQLTKFDSNQPLITNPGLLDHYDFISSYLKKVDSLLNMISIEGSNYQHPAQKIRNDSKYHKKVYAINTQILKLLSSAGDEITGRSDTEKPAEKDPKFELSKSSYIDMYRLFDEGIRIKSRAIVNSDKATFNKIASLAGHFYNALGHIILADPVKKPDLLYKTAGVLRFHSERQFDGQYDKLGRVWPWKGVSLGHWEAMANGSGANTFGTWCRGVLELVGVEDQKMLEDVYWFGYYLRTLQNLKQDIDSFSDPKSMIMPLSAPVVVHLERDAGFFSVIEKKLQETDLKLKDIRNAIRNSPTLDICRQLVPKYKSRAFQHLKSMPQCKSKALLEAVEVA